MENRNASKVSRGVLDFSSGSEEDEEEHVLRRKASNLTAVDRNKGGNAATDPGRMSLLQHGFSKLFERMKGKELGDEDSSTDIEDNLSEEDAEDQKNEDISSNTSKSSNKGNDAGRLPKLGIKLWDSDSDEEDRANGYGGKQKKVSLVKNSDDAMRKTHGLTNKKITVDDENDDNSTPDKNKPNKLKTTVPKVDLLEAYLDESEDLDIEVMTKPKRDVLDSHCKGEGKGRGELGCNRKRKSSSVRNKDRLKYSEEIETFTSSEDEHNPVKKGRSAGCKFTSPQTEKSRVELPKDGPSATTADGTERRAGMSKAVRFTSLKSQTSPASKRKDGTIDIVLGEIQYLPLFDNNL